MFYIFLILYAIIFVVVELLQKNFFSSINWARKATHVISGILSVFLPFYLSRQGIMILAAIFTVALAISKLKGILHLHKVSRSTFGEVLFPIAIGVLAFLVLPQSIDAFVYAILVLALCDTAAETIGLIFPIYKVKVLGQTKSLGGSLGFLLVALCVSLFLFPTTATIGTIFLVSIFLTIIEFVSVYGFDNLILPISASLFYISLFPI